MKTAILILIKNPVLGRAKTRLAKHVGDEKALSVYLKLLDHTREITTSLDCDRLLFYSHFIDQNDGWPVNFYQKFLQYQSGDLGERMYHAFEEAFRLGYEKVLVIGSDNFELTTDIITDGIAALDDHDFVIGPAVDGGYYLIGMKILERKLFEHKKWSTSSVYKDTIANIALLEASVEELPILNDVDEYDDVMCYPELLALL